MIAGSQGGKTEFGSHWLYREIQRRGPGDYLIASPTFRLMERKLLPAFIRVFDRLLKLGRYRTQAQVFEFSEDGARRTFGDVGDVPTNVLFGHAANSESLESMTVKAALLDEVGQKEFKLNSWEAVQRRLAIHEGRALIGTTPYNFGWLKQLIYDPWIAASKNHPDIDVIQFKSIENPAFPRREYQRLREILPAWKFRMMHEGQFEKPAGMIYDCWDDSIHKVPRFAIPAHWPRHLGIDFGGVNTAGVFLAEEMNGEVEMTPTGRFFAYREYHAGSRTVKEHARELLKNEPMTPDSVGGAKSEWQWRQEFREAGLPIREPVISDVEVGIARVYGTIKRRELFVFDDMTGLLDEIGTYARELDDLDEPTEKIADKESFHRLDAVRYIVGWLKPEKTEGPKGIPMVVGRRWQ